MRRSTRLASPLRDVLALSWPIAVSMLSFTAMGVVDTLFVGQLGTGPLAAVGLGSIAAWLPLGFGAGLLTGAKVAMSQRIGAGCADGARLLAWQALWLAGVLGALAAVVSLGADDLVAVLGAAPDWRVNAADYTRLRMLAAPLFFATHALSAWFQTTGAPRTAMTATLAGNVTNIALDPLFIFGWGPVPAMGVAGAGLATAAGFGVSAAWLVWAAWPALRPASCRLDRSLLRRIWSLGAPAGGRATLEVGAFLVFAAVLARSGELALAAHVLVIRVVSVSFLPGHAVGEAACVLVGQHVGARHPNAARAAMGWSMAVALAVMGSFGLLFLVAPSALLSPFDPSPALLAVALELMAIAALFQLLDAVAMVGLGALNGAGDTRFTMVVGVACAWLVKLPVGAALALGAGLGASGAWLGLLVEIAVVAGLCLLRLRGDAWLGEAADAEAVGPAPEEAWSAAV